MKKKTEIKYQYINRLDSTIIQMSSDIREINYDIKIERKYEGLIGDKKFFGTGKWKVRMDKKNKNGIEIFLIEDNYKDIND